jgi:hypothetical protein
MRLGNRCKIVVLVVAVVAVLSLCPEAGAVTFEAPPVYTLKEILPEDVLTSPYYKIRDNVTTNGYFFHFEVESSYGLYNVESMALLKTRLFEIYTLNKVIDEYKDKDGMQAINAVGDQLKATATGVVKLITDPIGSFEKIGKGIGTMFSRIALSIKNSGSNEGDSPLDSTPFGTEKRKLAAELHLDIYSTNSKVQEFLDEVADARASRRVMGNIVIAAAPGGVAIATLGHYSKTENQLRDMNPDELRHHLTQMLKAMGIDDPLIEKFIRQPKISLSYKTFVTNCLDYMADTENRGLLIKSMLSATTEQDAAFYVQMADILAKYSLTGNEITKLLPVAAMLPVALTKDKRLVAAIPLDSAYLSEDMFIVINAIDGVALENNIESKVIILTGKASSAFTAEINRRGYKIVFKEFGTI